MARPSIDVSQWDDFLSMAFGSTTTLLDAANEIGLTLRRIYRLEPRLLDHTDYAQRNLAEMVLMINEWRGKFKRELDALQDWRSDQNIRKEFDE
jgi:hypothetical protein